MDSYQRIDKYALLDGIILLCPECKGPNLHHKAVRVKNRESEDKKGVSHLISRLSTVSTEMAIGSDSWFGRRDDIAVGFTCEGCDFHGELRLYQHKGETFLGWATRSSDLSQEREES
jgi:uncharacterized protein YbaR (Trm112 family)